MIFDTNCVEVPHRVLGNHAAHAQRAWKHCADQKTATAFMEQYCFLMGGGGRNGNERDDVFDWVVMFNSRDNPCELICASPKPHHSYWRIQFNSRYRTVNNYFEKNVTSMSPTRQKWQCGWFENESENNLPSSETLSQSEGTDKSLISKPKTELNEYTHKLQIPSNKNAHSNVITLPRLTVTCFGWLKIKSVWKRPRLAT